MTTVIPRTALVGPDGYTNPPLVIYSATLELGEVISASWSGVTVDAGWSHPGWEFNVGGGSYGYNDAFPQGSNTFSYTVPSSGTYTVTIQGGGGYSTPLHFHIADFTMSVTFPSLGFCQYGTQMQGGQPLNVLVGLDLITTVASIAAGLWMVPFLLIAYGLTIDVNLLCAAQPPKVPQTADLSKWTPADALAFIQAAIWNNWCQCTPAAGGAPAPVPPPVPQVIGTGSSGAPVTSSPVLCDDMDPCDLWNSMLNTLGALAAQVAQLRGDVTLIQRQHVPFAYVPGVIFMDLSGNGELAVSAILALSVQSSTVPATLGLVSADPEEYRYLGRLSLGTADGWSRQLMISHNPHLVLDIDGTITRIGYSLSAGVVANIQTFVREP